jgi:hypothetical protein
VLKLGASDEARTAAAPAVKVRTTRKVIIALLTMTTAFVVAVFFSWFWSGGSKPLLLGADMAQDVVKDVHPDGTIRFKTTMTQRNATGAPLKTLRVSNSDFVRVDKLTDARGRAIPFTVARAGQMTLRYEATLAGPVEPGAEYSYVMEGTEAGLVKPLAQPGEFEYTMRHWPGNIRTRRIERHLLPAGARLISKAPADLAERTRDGRVELFIDRLIPDGDSLEISYRWAKQGE